MWEISELGETEFYADDAEDVAALVGDADAAICNKTKITAEVFARCPNLKYIGLFATGYNNVDIEAATRAGAVVCNVPDYSTDAVAQHTFALMLNQFSRAAEYAESVKQGDWIHAQRFSYFGKPTYEIRGLTLGVVGFGNIGRRVAELGEAFRMNVLVWNRTSEKVTEAGFTYVQFEELLQRADVVTLHLPLNPETHNLMNENSLAKMKRTAVLMNTARGGLIDEDALAKALNTGVIGGACLDVLKKEPMQPDCVLQTAKNCTITPHIAWAPEQTRRRLVSMVAKNLRCWASGKPIHVVNGAIVE